MNPLSHPQIAQSTHREYEAKYGSRYNESETRRTGRSRLTRQKLVLALSGASILGTFAALITLF